jgi:uncharacterized metal-binding protein YceD (DUF177 family)
METPIPKFSRKRNLSSPPIFIEECKARRTIELVESVTGIQDQYLLVKSVEYVATREPNLIGVSSEKNRQMVRNCSRCVVPFHRKCDLSTKTINDLTPQTNDN